MLGNGKSVIKSADRLLLILRGGSDLKPDETHEPTYYYTYALRSLITNSHT